MAVDINKIQPSRYVLQERVEVTMLTVLSIPRGLTIEQVDIEESWDRLLFDCDLVHIRLLRGSIKTVLWPEIYRKAFKYLSEAYVTPFTMLT